MARRKSLLNMSVDELIRLRDEVARTLSEKTSDLRRQLAALIKDDSSLRGAKRGRKKRKTGARRKMKKSTVVHTGPDGKTWNGRGRPPLWMKKK